MLKLGSKRYAEATQLVDASKVYGSVNDVVKGFIKDSGIKDAQLRIKSEVNLDNPGQQLMFIIREIDSTKKVGDLLTSDDIMLSKTMSDMVRSGELHVSALQSFMVVSHENNTNGAIYPLIVRAQDVADDKRLDKFAVGVGTAITKVYERESVDPVINRLNL